MRLSSPVCGNFSGKFAEDRSGRLPLQTLARACIMDLMKGGLCMRIRYIPADPAGNLTGLVLTHVSQEMRPALAARLMAVCPEGFEQIAFIDEDSLTGPLPRMEMMGGEFCGNASRAFGWYAAQRRGRGETALCVSVSGAAAQERISSAESRRTNSFFMIRFPSLVGLLY